MLRITEVGFNKGHFCFPLPLKALAETGHMITEPIVLVFLVMQLDSLSQPLSQVNETMGPRSSQWNVGKWGLPVPDLSPDPSWMSLHVLFLHSLSATSRVIQGGPGRTALERGRGTRRMKLRPRITTWKAAYWTPIGTLNTKDNIIICEATTVFEVCYSS